MNNVVLYVVGDMIYFQTRLQITLSVIRDNLLTKLPNFSLQVCKFKSNINVKIFCIKVECEFMLPNWILRSITLMFQNLLPGTRQKPVVDMLAKFMAKFSSHYLADFILMCNSVYVTRSPIEIMSIYKYSRIIYL